MTFLSTDQTGTLHVVTKRRDGFWKGKCGYGTGEPEYETEAEERQAAYVLMHNDKGCMRCVNKLMPTTKNRRNAYAR